MVLAGKDVTALPLTERQALLEKKILPKLKEPVRYTGTLDAKLSDLVASVKAHGLEGWSPNAATAATNPANVQAHG